MSRERQSATSSRAPSVCLQAGAGPRPGSPSSRWPTSCRGATASSSHCIWPNADFHLGRHRAARDRLKEHLDDASKEAEARYYYLSAVRGLGDRATYVSLSRALVKDHPDSPWAAETLDDLASYYVIDDQDDEADEVFRELLDRFPRHRYAERAAWKVGWTAYRSGKFAETVKSVRVGGGHVPARRLSPGVDLLVRSRSRSHG